MDVETEYLGSPLTAVKKVVKVGVMGYLEKVWAYVNAL